MCHMRLGHIDKALADMFKMSLAFAEQCCPTLEALLASGSAKAKKTAEETERLGHVQALLLAFKAKKQSSSKVRDVASWRFQHSMHVVCHLHVTRHVY